MDRRKLGTLLVLVALLLLAAGLLGLMILPPGDPAGEDEARSRPAAHLDGPDASLPATDTTDAADDDVAGASSDAAAGAAPDGADAEDAVRRLPVRYLPVTDDDNEFARAARPAPPPGAPAVSPGGRRPGRMVPFETPRWASPPEPKGTCRVEGRVVDEAGDPLEGAIVYRVTDASAAEGDVLSFRYLKQVAECGPGGAFAADGLPSGEFALVANHHRAMNRPRGMDCVASVGVILDERETRRDVLLVVPVRFDDLGAVEGRLVDSDGRPVPGARVFVGYQETRSGADGRFRADGVPAGAVVVLASLTGYLQVEESVTVLAGATASVEIGMRLAETGSLSLAGIVEDGAGNSIAGARVYVGHGQGTLRPPFLTGEDGAFSFGGLPEKCGREPVKLSIHAPGYTGGSRNDLLLPASDVRIVLERILSFEVFVRARGTGEPIATFNIDVKREVEEDGGPRLLYVTKAIVYEESGRYEVKRTRPGRHVIFVESPERSPVKCEVDVPDSTAPLSVVVEI